MKEIFNHAHSSLRSVIEDLWGFENEVENIIVAKHYIIALGKVLLRITTLSWFEDEN